MKPIVVTVKNASVRIYRKERRKGGNIYQQFDVADYSTGRRRFISFADEEEARRKAREIASSLGGKKGDVVTLDGAAASAYLRAIELIEPTGIALELAAAQFAQAHSTLNGQSITDAVNYYVKRQPSALTHKTCQEVYDELLEAKRKDGTSVRYLQDLQFRLRTFVKSFQCGVASVTASLVNEWLRALKCGPRSRNNFRRAIVTLFSFAEAHDHLPKGHLDFDKVAKAKEPHAQIDIFTPKQLAALLTAAQLNPDDLPNGYNRRFAGPDMLLFLVLGAFSGLRTAEILRQRWEDMLLDRGFIRVTAAKGGTAQKRLVPIHENLKAWLRPHCRESGHVCGIVKIAPALARLAMRAGVPWMHNALRHSYISYRVAETNDVAKTSLEAGNSPQMIHKHYREVVAPEEAKEWFSISPPPR